MPTFSGAKSGMGLVKLRENHVAFTITSHELYHEGSGWNPMPLQVPYLNSVWIFSTFNHCCSSLVYYDLFCVFSSLVNSYLDYPCSRGFLFSVSPWQFFHTLPRRRSLGWSRSLSFSLVRSAWRAIRTRRLLLPDYYLRVKSASIASRVYCFPSMIFICWEFFNCYLHIPQQIKRFTFMLNLCL